MIFFDGLEWPAMFCGTWEFRLHDVGQIVLFCFIFWGECHIIKTCQSKKYINFTRLTVEQVINAVNGCCCWQRMTWHWQTTWPTATCPCKRTRARSWPVRKLRTHGGASLRWTPPTAAASRGVSSSTSRASGSSTSGQRWGHASDCRYHPTANDHFIWKLSKRTL